MINGKITEIEVRLIRQSSDLADGEQALPGIYSHVFKPKKKAPLSAKLLSIFRKDPIKAYDYVELPVRETDESEVFVSVELDGHKRKIRVTDPDDGIYFHEELNGPSEQILTNEKLVEFCTEEAVAYFDRSGYTWDSSWSRALV